ncbi:MAG: tyrosine-protein phosphatase [bacterium]
MIDLHSHTLPKLCDGSQSIETSLAMARMAVADGTTHLACTPHIYPGIYNNSTGTIQPALAHLQKELDQHEIPLKLVIGADTHMVPEVMQGLKDGRIPTLNHSRYFLLEPSHHVPVTNFVDQVVNFVNAGYIPLITHPERLSWVKDHYEEFIEAAKLGAWIQITAGALSGHFGRTAKKWANQFLLDGYVHVIASDAHGIDKRPPILSEGIDVAIQLLGDEQEVLRTVTERPQAVLDNTDPQHITPPPALRPEVKHHSRPQKAQRKTAEVSWFKRLFH